MQPPSVKQLRKEGITQKENKPSFFTYTPTCAGHAIGQYKVAAVQVWEKRWRGIDDAARYI